MEELQAADRQVWYEVNALFQKGWTLDDALREVCNVRCLLQSLLQPRPAFPKHLLVPNPVKGLLERSVSLLLAVFQAGGHTSLEQPPNALSWRQSMVQHYLLEVSASCCCVAACAFGMNVHKRWMFATSFAGLNTLACVCNHERSAHVDVAGKRLEDGTYLSRGTAEYPASLAAQTIRHLGDLAGPQDYASRDAVQLVPRKEMDALPVAF